VLNHGEFFATFAVKFAQCLSIVMLERYVTGIPTECSNKNWDTLAQVRPGMSERQLQNVFTDTAWDKRELSAQCIQQVLTLATDGELNGHSHTFNQEPRTAEFACSPAIPTGSAAIVSLGDPSPRAFSARSTLAQLSAQSRWTV